jgi:hypothetical protein
MYVCISFFLYYLYFFVLLRYFVLNTQIFCINILIGTNRACYLIDNIN